MADPVPQPSDEPRPDAHEALERRLRALRWPEPEPGARERTWQEVARRAADGDAGGDAGRGPAAS